MPSRKWLILPILVCLIGILPLNTSFYTLVRVIVFCSAIAVGLQTKDHISEQGVIMLGIVAIVFNPIYPIYINDKFVWIVLDLAAAGVFFAFMKVKFTGEDEAITRYVDNHFNSSDPKSSTTVKGTEHIPPQETIDVDQATIAQTRVLQNMLETIFTSLFNSQHTLSFKKDFFAQEYVLGFITGYAACIEDVSFNGTQWSKEKRGSFYLVLYKNFMDGAASAMIQVLEDLEKAAQMRTRSDFLRGEEEGALVAVSHLGKLRKDLDDQILREAQAAARRQEISVTDALVSVTIKKYFSSWEANETYNNDPAALIPEVEEIGSDVSDDHFIPKDWLIKKINMKDLELEHDFPEKPDDEWHEWKLFKSKYTSGDEVWEFDSPSEYWETLAGSAGYVIIRDGKIIAELETMRN